MKKDKLLNPVESNAPTENAKLVYRLLAVAKGVLNCNAYSMEDVFIHSDLLAPHEIEDLASARIDLMEAYHKIESVLKSHMK